jgi:hypothetical protein
MTKLTPICLLMLVASLFGFSEQSRGAVPQQSVLDSYEQFENIDQAAKVLRKQTAEAKTHSFSRDWFDWEFLLRRYIDEGRRDENALKMLAAYFRGAVLDRYRALDAQGEGKMFYIFNTSMDGNKSTRISSDKVFLRDVHGGGGHGGWGSHARMLIYEELVKQEILSREERALFREIVVQSLSEDFLDFNRLERGANNRPYKNTGGIAAAVRVFPICQGLRNWRHGLSDNGENL